MTDSRTRWDWQTALVLRVLPLLWHGRLSWMRIALALTYGTNTYGSFRGWQIDSPDLAYEGWMLHVVPEGLREALLNHPQRVSVLVLVLVALCVVGLATRPALFMLAVLGLFIRAAQTSQGLFDHEGSLTTQVLLVLVFAPGTNAISLEHFIRWWRSGRTNLWVSITAPYRQWGVKLVLGLLALTYTTSGLSKLRFGGLEWLNGETLGFYLRGLTSGTDVYLIGGGPTTWRDDFGLEMYAYGNYRYGEYGSIELANFVDWMAHTPAILMMISIATVTLELAGFLLFVPRLRSILLLAYIGMHTTIGFLMGLHFVEYQIICFLLLEWTLLGSLATRWFNKLRTARGRAPIQDYAEQLTTDSSRG